MFRPAAILLRLTIAACSEAPAGPSPTSRGYPAELFIDESELIADEELGLTLSELEPLSGAAGSP